MYSKPNFSKAHLIGFSSLPFKDQDKFIKEEIKEKLFSKYKSQLEKQSGGAVFPKELFAPQMYYLWGKYDVCAISEVDDFEFATRFFRSYNPIGLTDEPIEDDEQSKVEDEEPSSEMVNFDYKVLMGVNPLEDLLPDNPLPYIAISQLKVNSALLIGNGGTLLEKIKGYILSVAKIDDIAGSLIDIKICESFSYHELVVVITSNSIKRLWNIVGAVRGVKFGTFLRKMGVSEEESCKLLKNSLLSDLAPSSNKCSPYEIENHLFESTLTNLGFHFDLFDSQSNFTGRTILPINDEEITFFSRWNIKPGHIQETLDVLDSLKIDNIERHIVTGKGDMILKTKVKISEGLDMNRLLDFPEIFFKQSIHNCELLPESDQLCLGSNIIDTFTSVSVSTGDTNHEGTGGQIDYKKHFTIHETLKEFTIQPTEITALWKQMKALWIPKALSEKIMKLISTYNNAVMNPDMYIFYVELQPFLKKSFISTINAFYENKRNENFHAQTLYTILEQTCHEIETGFQNRFYQSYWTSEVPEVNTDYSGGVHNLISAYDSCYKAINNAFKLSENNTSFIYVKSDSKVNSTIDAVKMNYLHLIQPLNFFSMATHEACNYALEKWYMSHVVKTDSKAKENLGKRISKQFDRAGLEFVNEVVTTNALLNTGSLFDETNSSVWFSNLRDNLNSRIDRFINPSLLHYHIIGRINYQYGFQKDIDLLDKVSWNYFFQAGHIYIKPTQINPEDFLALAIRMLLLRFSTGQYDISISYENFIALLPKEKYVQRWIHIYGEDLYTIIIDLFRDDSPFKEWFNEWEDILNNNNIIPDGANIADLKGLVKNYTTENSRETLNKIYAVFDGKSTMPWELYIAIAINYLSDNCDLTVMEREYGLGVPTIREGSNNKGAVYIDPCGGTFVVGSENRKTYLSSRVSLLRFLYHLSLLYKKKYISNIINESSKGNSSAN